MSQFDKLKQLNQDNLERDLVVADKTDKELSELRTQEVFVKSIQALANLIQGHTTQTVVLNQLKDYATSKDIDIVSRGLASLLSELETKENTDLSPVVGVLNEAVSELQKIPKEQQEIEIPEPKDYTEQFKQILSATQDVIKAVKAQETVVEAPVVNLPAPEVKVDAPDLKPLEKHSKELKKAIEAIIIPQPIDNSKVLADHLKEQKKTNKILEEMPLGGSSGGYIPRDDSGNVPVSITGELVASVDYDYLDVQQTSAAVETFVYKLGGSGGTTVRTIVLTYTDSSKADIDSVAWS